MIRFYDFLAPILTVAAALALLLALVLLIQGSFRKYRIIAAYIVWELFATAALTAADLLLNGSSTAPSADQLAGNRLYARLYWTNDVFDDLFRFALVVVLLYQAAEGAKRVSGRFLGALVAVMAILPFVLFPMNSRPVDFGALHMLFPRAAWFNSTSELLNFGAAIMNLVLWAALLATRKRDPQLLAVSAGLGVVVTGTAVAYGLRHLAGETQFGGVAVVFLNLTQLAGWTIWCWAFGSVGRRSQVASTVPSP